MYIYINSPYMVLCKLILFNFLVYCIFVLYCHTINLDPVTFFLSLMKNNFHEIIFILFSKNLFTI